jgi:hypothetical protein
MQAPILSFYSVRFPLILLFYFNIFFNAQAQHGRTDKEHGHIRVGLVIGHTLIPTVVDGERENLLIPSWGMDLEYWLNQRWGVGLHNDIEVETFEVLSDDDEYIERIYPLVFTLDVLWRPWKGLVLLAGPGIELEQNRNLQVFRFGAEYEVELFQGWDLSPNFFYDARSDAFGTWSVGLGVGKRF